MALRITGKRKEKVKENEGKREQRKGVFDRKVPELKCKKKKKKKKSCLKRISFFLWFQAD